MRGNTNVSPDLLETPWSVRPMTLIRQVTLVREKENDFFVNRRLWVVCMTITGMPLIWGKFEMIQYCLNTGYKMTLFRTFDGVLHKTVSYTRSEEEKKTCPKSSNFFDPGAGKKKLCLIERDDYIALGAPAYSCNLNAQFDPTKIHKLGKCRPSVTDGNLGI